MSNLREHKKRWLNLISKNELDSLFSDMSTLLDSNSNIYYKLATQKARFRRCYEQEMLGEITKEQANTAYNNIQDGLLLLVQKLIDTDLGKGGKLTDPMEELILQLKLKQPLTPLHLVNCNRIQINRKFKRTFRSWENENKKHQFYFALGCPSQEPEGFAERMVFEILSSKANELVDTVNYNRVVGTERLYIPELPVGFTLNDSISAFKKHITERFDKTEKDFSIFLNKELPNRRDKYIAFPFGIMASDWDPDLMEEYLHWIIEQFSSKPQSGPNCIFIFVIWLKNAHRPEKIRFEKEVIDHIERFTTKHEDQVSFLYPFNEVPRYYLEEWLEKVIDIDQKEVETIFSILENQLNDEEKRRYQTEDQLLDMERVEELQEKIWRLYNNN